MNKVSVRMLSFYPQGKLWTQHIYIYTLSYANSRTLTHTCDQIYPVGKTGNGSRIRPFIKIKVNVFSKYFIQFGLYLYACLHWNLEHFSVCDYSFGWRIINHFKIIKIYIYLEIPNVHGKSFSCVLSYSKNKWENVSRVNQLRYTVSLSKLPTIPKSLYFEGPAVVFLQIMCLCMSCWKICV